MFYCKQYYKFYLDLAIGLLVECKNPGSHQKNIFLFKKKLQYLCMKKYGLRLRIGIQTTNTDQDPGVKIAPNFEKRMRKYPQQFLFTFFNFFFKKTTSMSAVQNSLK
jgi:hypothetical protein